MLNNVIDVQSPKQNVYMRNHVDIITNNKYAMSYFFSGITFNRVNSEKPTCLKCHSVYKRKDSKKNNIF